MRAGAEVSKGRGVGDGWEAVTINTTLIVLPFQTQIPNVKRA